mgnify:CR=1 FL=1
MSSQKSYSFSRQVLVNGIRDGIPIGLGYFAVSFSLGIAARKAGLSPFQAFSPVFSTMLPPENTLPLH